jgi:hypothetical protein
MKNFLFHLIFAFIQFLSKIYIFLMKDMFLWEFKQCKVLKEKWGCVEENSKFSDHNFHFFFLLFNENKIFSLKFEFPAKNI